MKVLAILLGLVLAALILFFLWLVRECLRSVK